MVFDDDFLVQSAKDYVAHLSALQRAPVSADCKRAATTIANATMAAIGARAGTPVEALAGVRAALDAVPRAERTHLINQMAFGLGSRDASLLIVGQEHAYDPTNTASFALEAVGLTMLWLAGDRPDLATALCGRPATEHRAFNLFPTDWYPNRPPGHTWRCVGKVVDATHDDGWCTRAHLIEMSAHPARYQEDGKPPTPQRLKFLEGLLQRCRARVVLFHGRQWKREQEQLAAKYLGVRPHELRLGTVAAIPSASGKSKTKIEGQAAGERCVLFSKMLNGSAGMSASFIDSLRLAVAQGLRGHAAS